MRKQLLVLTLATLGMTLASCGSQPTVEPTEKPTEKPTVTPTEAPTEAPQLLEENMPTVLVPGGSTILGVADYAAAHKDKFTVGAPTDLAPAMIKNQYDVVVAPIVAGVNVFGKAKNFVLDNVFVWGNLYLLSNEEITDAAGLKGKEITAFGKGNTPQIILETILKSENIETTAVSYLKDVTAATAAFIGGTADVIVAAEPQVQMILAKKPDAHILDMQELYAKITNTVSYPQAGIFVSKKYMEKVENHEAYLDLIRNSVISANENPETTAENAMSVTNSFDKLGKEKLAAAIPGCHLGLKSKEEQKTSIEKYLTTSNEIVGTEYVLPSEEFYK